MKEGKHIIFLDYVRIVACLMVMLVHSSENFYGADPTVGMAGNVSMLANESIRLHRKQHTNDWRNTRRAALKSLAPMKCATCTENPMLAADARPPSSHVVVSTRPMAAEARAPRCPTIEASMKNITVAEICARILGMERLTMRRSFSPCVIVFPSRI